MSQGLYPDRIFWKKDFPIEIRRHDYVLVELQVCQEYRSFWRVSDLRHVWSCWHCRRHFRFIHWFLILEHFRLCFQTFEILHQKAFLTKVVWLQILCLVWPVFHKRYALNTQMNSSSFHCLLPQPQLQLFSCSCSCSWSRKVRLFHKIITFDDHFIVRDSRTIISHLKVPQKMAKTACFVLQLQLQLQLNSCSCGCSRRRQNELIFHEIITLDNNFTVRDIGTIVLHLKVPKKWLKMQILCFSYNYSYS